MRNRNKIVVEWMVEDLTLNIERRLISRAIQAFPGQSKNKLHEGLSMVGRSG